MPIRSLNDILLNLLHESPGGSDSPTTAWGTAACLVEARLLPYEREELQRSDSNFAHLLRAYLASVSVNRKLNSPEWRAAQEAAGCQEQVSESGNVDNYRWLFVAMTRLNTKEFIEELLHSLGEEFPKTMEQLEMQLAGKPEIDPAKPQQQQKPKRSTEKGEGRAKLIGALTRHHKYADGGCLNLEPIGNNALARMVRVEKSTASDFFKKQFKGHSNYRTICCDSSRLVAALKLLNDEFAPHLLLGGEPPVDNDRGDEE